AQWAARPSTASGPAPRTKPRPRAPGWLASTSAAAARVTVPPNLGIKISNPARSGSYPITSQTFIVVNKDRCKAGIPGGEGAAKGVVKFIQYGLNEGQSILGQADYASLPAPILAKSRTP